MQRLILATALSLASGSVLAVGLGITCDKPEYLQLKTADKAELQQEFCRTTRMYTLNMKLQRDARAAITTSSTPEAAKRQFAELDEYLNSALTCSKASAEFAGALQRRFKTKAPSDKICLSPGGI